MVFHVSNAQSARESAPDSVDILCPGPHAEPSLVKALLHGREAVMRQFRPTLRMHGLTEQQWRVLGELLTVDEIAASDLAAATCLRASSLSRIIKDLEHRDYLSRRSQLEDLRRTMISITGRGRGIMRQLDPVASTLGADIAGRYGSDRLASLLGLSIELASTLGGAGGGADDGE